MFALDIRSILFIGIFLSVLSLIVVNILWNQNRKIFAGITYWLGYYILQLLAVGLIYLRGVIPDLFSLVLPNSLYLLASYLFLVGTQLFVGKLGRQIHNFVLLALLIVAQTYFSAFQPNLTARTIIFNAGILIFNSQILWLIFLRLNSEMRIINREIGLALIGLCFVSLARIIVSIFVPYPGNDFLARIC